MKNINYKKEFQRKDALIESNRKTIKGLKEENKGLYQLLDCAAAYIIKLINENSGKINIHREEIKKNLGNYRMEASVSEDGMYTLKVQKNE